MALPLLSSPISSWSMLGVILEEQQAVLEFMKYDLAVCISTLRELWRARALRIMCPEDVMLLLSIALLITLLVTTSQFQISYDLKESSKWVSCPSLGSVTGTFSKHCFQRRLMTQPPPLERIYTWRVLGKLSLLVFVNHFDVENLGEKLKFRKVYFW